MEIVQLIYVSSATAEWDAEEIRRILDSSARHNTSQQITGMLLYSNGSFVQVLEGEEAAVTETMALIAKDPRHHDINVLSKSAVADREFGAWSMGFRAITAADAATWPNYAPFFQNGFDAALIGAKPGLAWEILTLFAAPNLR